MQFMNSNDYGFGSNSILIRSPGPRFAQKIRMNASAIPSQTTTKKYRSTMKPLKLLFQS